MYPPYDSATRYLYRMAGGTPSVILIVIIPWSNLMNSSLFSNWHKASSQSFVDTTGQSGNVEAILVASMITGIGLLLPVIRNSDFWTPGRMIYS